MMNCGNGLTKDWNEATDLMGPMNRRKLLKSTISLVGMTGIAGIVQKSFGRRIGQLSNSDQVQEVPGNMTRQDQVESHWLDRQVGFQLAHEQFPVPELVELGVGLRP